jgi:hypothetical protein
LQGGGSIALANDGSAKVTLPDGSAHAVMPTASAPSAVPRLDGAAILTDAAAAPRFVLQSMRSAAGLSVSDFGLWASISPGGSVGATSFYAGGSPTPPALLPPAGSGITATYSGLYRAVLDRDAVYAGAPVAAGPFGGSIDLSVDFGAGSVATKFGGLLAGTFTATSSLDRAAGTYSVNGGTFSPYAAAAYQLNGAFYGAPAAVGAPPETAGILHGTIGPATTTAPAPSFTGAFGARR